jgi:hypothetical protein
VERHDAGLEQQPDRDEGQADEDQTRAADGAADRRMDHAQVERSGEHVEHGDAEQHERRGERAQQEVLQGRLLAQQATATRHAAEQVQRQREHLQGHEQGQQVGRRGEDHHAR